jgi:hypothetical protein
VLLCVTGSSFCSEYASVELPTFLSSDPAFGEQARRSYRKSGCAAALKVYTNLGRLLLCRRGGIVVSDSKSRLATIVQAGVQTGSERPSWRASWHLKCELELYK